MTALLSLISTLHEHSQQLIACLNEEKNALDNQAYDELSALAPKKQLIIDKLNSIEQQCIDACSGNDINKHIKESGKRSLQTIWDSTQKLLQDCRKSNEINGLIINKQSIINQDVLTLLTGNQQQGGQTYNAQGNQTNNKSILNNIEA